MATTDAGAHWHSLTAPRAWLLNRGPVVSQVVFASQRNGWLYGQSGARLWATHDGGAHWRKLSLGGGIVTLATSAGTAYAVIAAPGGRRDELLRSPAGQNAWARVGTITGGFGSVVAVSGPAAWFGSSSPATGAGTLWATADGTHWHRYPFACPGRGYQLSGIAAASRSRVVFLCTDAQGTYHTNKEVLRSVDGGRTEHLTGHAPVPGDDSPGGFAVPRHRSMAITIAAVTPGPDFLYRSPNGGQDLGADHGPRHRRRRQHRLPGLPDPAGRLGRGRPAGREPEPTAADIGRRPQLAPGQLLNRRAGVRPNARRRPASRCVLPRWFRPRFRPAWSAAHRTGTAGAPRTARRPPWPRQSRAARDSAATGKNSSGSSPWQAACAIQPRKHGRSPRRLPRMPNSLRIPSRSGWTSSVFTTLPPSPVTPEGSAPGSGVERDAIKSCSVTTERKSRACSQRNGC